MLKIHCQANAIHFDLIVSSLFFTKILQSVIISPIPLQIYRSLDLVDFGILK